MTEPQPIYEVAILPGDESGIDPEVIALCEAMNKLPGIHTIGSCCGHGQEPFQIWFVADNLEALPPLLYWFDACHCGRYGWQVIAYTDCGMCPVRFRVEGPVGDDAYSDALEITRLIEQYLEEVDG